MGTKDKSYRMSFFENVKMQKVLCDAGLGVRLVSVRRQNIQFDQYKNHYIIGESTQR